LPQGLVSFGTDEAGHIYAMGYEGMIYQLDFSETASTKSKPNNYANLLATGVISLVAAVFGGAVHAQTLKRVEQTDFGKTQDGTEVSSLLFGTPKA